MLIVYASVPNLFVGARGGVDAADDVGDTGELVPRHVAPKALQLERFVNTDPDLEPVDLVAIAVDIETNIAIETITVGGLPPGWRTYPAPLGLAVIGERWLGEARSAVLSVPSVVIPNERNFVLNPPHADFSRLAIHPSEPFSLDPRMWKARR